MRVERQVQADFDVRGELSAGRGVRGLRRQIKRDIKRDIEARRKRYTSA